jgi:hypothetical protein
MSILSVYTFARNMSIQNTRHHCDTWGHSSLFTFLTVVHMDTAGVVLSFSFYVSGVDRALRARLWGQIFVLDKSMKNNIF